MGWFAFLHPLLDMLAFMNRFAVVKTVSLLMVLVGCADVLIQAQSRTTQLPTGYVRQPAVLPPAERQTYFMNPNGLEKAAHKYGEFLVEGEVFAMGSFSDLAAAAKRSELIVRGTIMSMSAELIDNGCQVESHYVVHSDAVIKGSYRGDAQFAVLGGRYIFPNGTSAEIRTTASTFFKVGGHYFLFFYKDEKDTALYAAEGAAFRLLESGEVDPLVRGPDRDKPKEKIDPFLKRVRELVKAGQ